MKNAVTGTNRQSAPAREISVITEEIRDITRKARQILLASAVEIGRRLAEAKEVLPHGGWSDWLKNEVEFSQSTANNFMRLYEEYGSARISLFDIFSNSQPVVNLPYSKALELLAVPREERASFAEKVDAEHLTRQELRAAIRERDEAIKAAEAEKERNETLSERLIAAEEAKKEAEKAASDVGELQSQVEKLEAEIKKAKADAETANRKYEDAKKNPEIPKSTLEKLKTEATDAAEKELAAKTAKELEQAKKAAEDAKKRADAAKEAEKAALLKLEETQRKLKTASPEVAAFKALFDSVQTSVGKLRQMITAIEAEDPGTAKKLAAALKAFGQTF